MSYSVHYDHVPIRSLLFFLPPIPCCEKQPCITFSLGFVTLPYQRPLSPLIAVSLRGSFFSGFRIWLCELLVYFVESRGSTDCTLIFLLLLTPVYLGWRALYHYFISLLGLVLLL